MRSLLSLLPRALPVSSIRGKGVGGVRATKLTVLLGVNWLGKVVNSVQQASPSAPTSTGNYDVVWLIIRFETNRCVLCDE
jgi:hypothetical protein